MKVINLADMSNKMMVRAMMEKSEYTTFKQIAERLGVPETSFRSMLNRNSMKLEDLQAVADLLGYTVKLEKEK